MSRRLLVSGSRSTFSTLAFDATEKRLSALASRGDCDILLELSEGDESGLLYTFEIDHAKSEHSITSQQPTLAAPAHLSLLHDHSAVALGTYLGGSVALYPTSSSVNTEIVLEDKGRRSEIFLDFPYASVGHGPDPGRQKQCHLHQIIEDRQGLLYAPDLGSDRVWILWRRSLSLGICGWLQCPPGTGSRHAVFNHDESIMYVIGELSHTVVAFDLRDAPKGAVQSIEGFAPNIISLDVPLHHQNLMDSSEICVHPKVRNVLYVSNRWQRHIARREPQLQDVSADLPPGDTITVILLSDDGRAVTDIRYVKTGADVIRGMQISGDGKFAVVAGQEGGGLEIYNISGTRGEIWKLATRSTAGLDGGLKHAVWL